MLKTVLKMLPLVLLLFATVASPARAITCNGSCDGPSADSTCYCDDSCFDFEDCCNDVCTYCPTLSGCGGGTGDCGNGYCEPTEDAATCPQDCSQGCGSISFEGCCDGQLLQYCEAGTLKSIDCSQSPSCGWQADGPYYDCGTAGTPDPSGMAPMACGGGTSPVCGNGVCEAGETAQSCPADCGGSQPVCGNGACEAGETAQSCPSDCDGGSGCDGKECGFDSQGNSCGTCPEGFFCTWDGHCESSEPCEPNCDGKQCGDDGCGGECGACPAGLVCTGGTCTSPRGDVQEQPEEDTVCIPDCEGRMCGSDGCGGACGEGCPEGFGCTEDGLCEEGYVPPEPEDITSGSTNTYLCPPGQTLIYGKCVATGEEINDSSSCSVGHRGPASAFWLLLALTLAVVGMRRISWCLRQ